MVKPLNYLFGTYRYLPFKWEVQRTDELSGTGDARHWQAELADPLWAAEIRFGPMLNSLAEEADAKVRNLHGSQEPFLMASSLFCRPKHAFGGGSVGTPSIGSIGSDRLTMSLSGLPGGFILYPGDKGQVAYSSNPTRYYFFEVASQVSGGSSFDVFPRVPLGVTGSESVTLINPACQVVIVPGSHRVGQVNGPLTTGGGFRVVQKR